MSFWGELKRRNVFKVAVAYLIVAWLIVQIANTFFPILHLPDWAVTLVAVLVILGFPLALLFAWAFELTPEGLKKTEHVPLEESITRITGQKLNYILVIVIILAVAYILFDNYYLDPRFIETELSTRVAELTPPNVDKEGAALEPQTVNEEETIKTIAVLPFEDLSPEKDQEYFVVGLSEELLNSLAKIPGLSVTSRTSAFSFKDTSKTIQEIASVLGVAHILEGSVRKADDALRITVQLIRVADDRHLWSETYDRKLEDIFEVQEDIANTVSGELKTTFGIDTLTRRLGSTDDPKAYELYLNALGMRNDTNRALESIDAAIALDPEFALALAEKALCHLSLASGGPGNADKANSEQNKAMSAALRAIEIEPDLAEAHTMLGLYQSIKGNFIAAELSFRKALELKSGVLLRIESIGMHYFAVGYFDKSSEMIEEAFRNDPLNQIVRFWRVQLLGQMGKIKQAEEEYDHVKKLFAGKWRNYYPMMALGLGDDIKTILDDMPSSEPIADAIIKNLDSPNEGLEKLRLIYSNDDNLSMVELLGISGGVAYFHDPEFALDILERVLSYDALDTMWFWYPIFHEVRQLPRFKEFVREIGLVDYWEQFGWPEICHKLDNGDFVCD